MYTGSGINNWVSIKERLYFFGGGYDGKTYEYGLTSKVNGFSIDSNPAEGTHFCGFFVNNIFENTGVIDNITIERCYINYGNVEASSAQGWVIKNCILVQLLSLFNATISNNIFLGEYSGAGQLYVFNSTISNNIFYDIYNNPSNNAIRATNSVINNNIFIFDSILNGTYTGINCNTSVFNNNLVYYSGGPVVTLPTLNNTGSGNLNNTDPQFFSARLAIGIDSLVMPAAGAYNWQLKTTSAGHLAGSDGTDIGLYGGLFPMPALDGVPPLPQVRRMDITTPQIPLNGSLNVHVIGTTRN